MATSRPARRPTRRTRRTSRRPSAGDQVVGGIIAVLFCVLVPLSILFAIMRAHPVAGTLLFLAVSGVATAFGVQRYNARAQRRAIWAARAQSIAAYLTMSPTEFEQALAFLCQRDGCRDVRVVGGAGDLAADVIATTPSGHRIVIQAKRYGPGTAVRSEDVQKVNGTYQHAHGGHVAAIVTTSRFTRPAAEYAARVGIRLFDHNALAGWVSRTGPAPWH